MKSFAISIMAVTIAAAIPGSLAQPVLLATIPAKAPELVAKQATPAGPTSRVPADSTPANGASSDESVRVLLTPLEETTLASPVAARINQFNVSLGSSFVAGQTLIQFECSEPTARLNMSKAELAGAVETHEAKVKMQGLDQASGVEVALAASAVAKYRAEVSLYASQIKQCTIAAPWAGRVSKVHVRAHMSVTPGQPLVDLVMYGPLKVRVNLPSSALQKIKLGKIFDVSIDETGQKYPARVSALNSRIDAVSQTIEMEAMMLPPYNGLLAGMSGIAKIGSMR